MNTKKKLIWLLALFQINFQGCQQNRSNGPINSINEAELAFDAYDYTKALDAYTSFWENGQEDSGKKEEKALCAQRLAYFAWHFERDINSARRWTVHALAIDHNKCASLNAMSAFELEAGNFEKALKFAEEATSEAKSNFETRLSNEQWCKVIFSRAVAMVEDKKSLDTAQIKMAAHRINDLAAKYPEDLDIAKLRIGIGLVNGDLTDTYAAWQNYFRIDDSKPQSGLLEKSLITFKKLKHIGVEICEMGNQLLDNLITVLINSRMFDYAALLLKHSSYKIKSPSDTLHNANVYNQYLKAAEDLSFQFYRSIAKGKANQQKFKDQLVSLEKKCWKALRWFQKGNSFSHQGFLKITKQLFGARFTQDIVNGYYGFYCWHEVANETVPINQYGRKSTLQLIAMDHLISKDYSGWFFNEQRVGGTATNNAIILVRPVMLQEPVLIWNYLNDPVQMKEMEDKIARMQIMDLKLVKDNPYALLPGLRLKILMRGTQKIYDSLKNSYQHNGNIKMAFITHFTDYLNHCSLTHEGRHAIDKQIGGFNSNQMEYRAKLSEVALSRAPLLTFAVQVLRRESENASHGKANGRLVKDMVRWMSQHKDQIKGFEPAVPYILQLDKLTDEQVVIAMKSLDPLATD